MNMNRNNDYEEEIDLLDLVYNLLKNFKKIFIVAVVFAVLGGGVAVYKSAAEDKIVKKIIENPTLAVEDNDILQSELSQIDLYFEKFEELAKQKDFLANSPRYDVNDENKIYTISINFKVTNATDIDGILYALDNSVLNDETLDEIVAKYGLEKNSEHFESRDFLRSMISINSISSSSDLVLDATTNKVKTLNLSFWSTNKEITENVGNAIADKIISRKEAVLAEFGSNISILNSSIRESDALYLRNEILVKTNEIDSLEDSLLFKLEDQDILNDYTRVQAKLIISKLKTLYPDLELKVGRGLVKNVVVFGMIGGFFMCAYYGVIYLLSGKLHTRDELTSKDIKVYGAVVTSDYKTILDKIFRKGNGESLNTVTEKIKLDVKSLPNQKLILATTLDDDILVSGVISVLQNELKIDGVYKNIANNPAYYEKCSEEACVILVEKLNETSTKSIAEAIYSARELKIAMLGAVVVD